MVDFSRFANIAMLPLQESIQIQHYLQVMRYQLQNYVVDFIYIDTKNVWFLNHFADIPKLCLQELMWN